MKNILLKMTCLVGILFFPVGIQASFLDGSEHGSGGDIKPLETESAWFLGKGKTIAICYEADKNFGVETPVLETAIRDAFSTWKEYFNQKAAPYFQSPQIQPAFEIKFLASCSGAEDLKIYFGVSNLETEKGKKSYFSPIAFAERTGYDVATSWGKGFVWIAAPSLNPYIDWKIPYALDGILLHEFGHVLGCEHVQGTIMTENIADMLYRGKLLTHVDEFRELVLPQWESFHLSGWMGGSQSASEYDLTFKSLTGKAVVGIPRAEIQLLGYDGELTLSDQEKDFVFKLQFTPFTQSFPSASKVFKAVGNAPSSNGPIKSVVWIPGGQGRVSFGKILISRASRIP